MATPNTQEGNEGTAPRTADQHQGDQATLPRRSDQDEEHSRSVENVASDQTVPEQVYADYAQNYDEDDAALNSRIPDVLLDAPMVSIKGLDFELDDLRAKVSLFAKVLDLVELSVGIDAYLSKVKLTIESVEVQALLKVRLDNVTAIIDRVLTTIDRNPQIVQEVASGVGSAVEDVGKGSGEMVGDVGQGAGQAAEQVGDSVSQADQGATDAAGEAAGQAGDATEQAPEGAEESSGRTAEGTAASGTQVLSETTDESGRAIRRVADESGGIVEQTLNESGLVSEEAVVGEASTPGEAGEQKDKAQATPAAERKAQDLGVDLSQIEGTGSGGRITVKDVTEAAKQA